MTTLFYILGILLTVLFFINIRPASEAFCRILCGFCVLILYNCAAPLMSVPIIAVNLTAAVIIGIFGIPGSIMLFCLTVFL